MKVSSIYMSYNLLYNIALLLRWTEHTRSRNRKRPSRGVRSRVAAGWTRCIYYYYTPCAFVYIIFFCARVRPPRNILLWINRTAIIIIVIIVHTYNIACVRRLLCIYIYTLYTRVPIHTHPAYCRTHIRIYIYICIL